MAASPRSVTQECCRIQRSDERCDDRPNRLRLRLNTSGNTLMLATVLASAFLALTLAAPAPNREGRRVPPAPGSQNSYGNTFVRLDMTVNGGSLSGRIALGDLQVDAQGRVKAAAAAPDRLTPIFDVVAKDSRLSFSHKDGDDTDHFEQAIRTGDQAELRFIPDEATLKDLKEAGLLVVEADRAEACALGLRSRGFLERAGKPQHSVSHRCAKTRAHLIPHTRLHSRPQRQSVE